MQVKFFVLALFLTANACGRKNDNDSPGPNKTEPTAPAPKPAEPSSGNAAPK